MLSTQPQLREVLRVRYFQFIHSQDLAVVTEYPGRELTSNPRFSFDSAEDAPYLLSLNLVKSYPSKALVTVMKVAFVILSFISAIQAAESGKDSEQCPKVAFLPAISEKHGSCVFSNNCNKVKCVMQDNSHKITVTLKINKCDNPLTATVKLQQSDTDLDWSHTLKDGEKAKVPTKSSSFTGELPVNDAALFIQVGLKKMNGTSVNYTVTLTGQVTVYGKTTDVNYVILEGRSTAVANDDCSWFSKQPAYVKVLVIAIPVVMVILVGTVGIAFCCYKRRSRGTNAQWPMHRLTNEV